MAVTKIWAIHDGVSRVVDYCTNPSKTKLSDLEQVLLYTLHHILTHNTYKRGNRTLWLIITIVLMNFVGPILYFLFGKEDA